MTDKFKQFDFKAVQDRIDAEIKKLAQISAAPALFINQEVPPVKNEISEERIAKIPTAWARDAIRNQQSEIRRLRGIVAIQEQIIAGRPDSAEIEVDADTWLDGGIDADIPLPKHTHINFGSDGRAFRAWLNPDGDLEVNSASGAILINPRAANAVIVKLADRR